MTRQIIISIVFLCLLLITVFVSIPYSNYVIVISTLLFISYQLFQALHSARKNPTGEVVFRQQSKSIRMLFVILALIITAGELLKPSGSILMITVYWCIVLYDIGFSLLTSKLKPIAHVINGNKLEQHYPWNTSRDLSSLNKMTLLGFTDVIELTFSGQKNLFIKRRDFSSSDIEKLITLCCERSIQTVSLSENLKKKLLVT